MLKEFWTYEPFSLLSRFSIFIACSTLLLDEVYIQLAGKHPFLRETIKCYFRIFKILSHDGSESHKHENYFFEYLHRVSYSIYVFYWQITKCNVFDIVFFVSFLRSSHEKIAQFSRVSLFYSNWVLLNYTWATKSAENFNFYTLTAFFHFFFLTNEWNVTGFTYQSIFYDLKRFFSTIETI